MTPIFIIFHHLSPAHRLSRADTCQRRNFTRFLLDFLGQNLVKRLPRLKVGFRVGLKPSDELRLQAVGREAVIAASESRFALCSSTVEAIVVRVGDLKQSERRAEHIAEVCTLPLSRFYARVLARLLFLAFAFSTPRGCDIFDHCGWSRINLIQLGKK